MSNWLKDRVESVNIHQKLHSIAFPATTVSNSEHKDRIRSLTRDEALALVRFVDRRTFTHNDITIGVRNVVECCAGLSAPFSRIIRHFDHAVSMGWKYAPDAFMMILDGLRDADISTTIEQERALVLLEESRWSKKYAYRGGAREERFVYDSSFTELAKARPSDIGRIIPLAQATTIHRRNSKPQQTDPMWTSTAMFQS